MKPQSNKNSIRKALLDKLLAQNPDFMSQQSKRLVAHMQPWLTQAHAQLKKDGIALFYPLRGELSLGPLDELLRQMHIPRYVPIWESPEKLMDFVKLPEALPIDALAQQKHLLRNMSHIHVHKLRTILVPGLAFDKHGHRLGRGHAFYDKLLAHVRQEHNKRPLVIGIALDLQVLEEVPKEVHDQPVDMLCTPDLGLITCG